MLSKAIFFTQEFQASVQQSGDFIIDKNSVLVMKNRVPSKENSPWNHT